MLRWTRQCLDCAFNFRAPSLPWNDSHSTSSKLFLDFLLNRLCLFAVGIIRRVGTCQQNNSESRRQCTLARRAHAALALYAKNHNRVYAFCLELRSELRIRLKRIA
jgi:hypothetical protein